MTQNRSSAVMQQRFEGFEDDDLDDFPTPPWATRALFEHVLFPTIGGLAGHFKMRHSRLWEPAANRGYMVHALRDYSDHVTGTDIVNYGAPFGVADFLNAEDMPASVRLGTEPTWVITNPPFREALRFIARAREVPHWQGTAVLVRSAFLEGVGRYIRLFRSMPPTIFAPFAERVVMHKGILRDPDVAYLDPATGKMKKPSTATSYCWLVWARGVEARPPVWIPPCRKELTRPGDYPEVT